VPVNVIFSAKYWSKWQDLNLRPCPAFEAGQDGPDGASPRAIENGWLHHGSTTEPGSIWIASASSHALDLDPQHILAF